MATTNDMVWIDDLDEEVCWRLVDSAVVGRVGFVLDGAPMILPVNFDLDGRTIVIRTAQTSLLEAVAGGAAVAFEIDHSDETAETGWSVLVLGLGEEVTEPRAVAAREPAAASLGARPERPLDTHPSHPDHGPGDQPEAG